MYDPLFPFGEGQSDIAGHEPGGHEKHGAVNSREAWRRRLAGSEIRARDVNSRRARKRGERQGTVGEPSGTERDGDAACLERQQILVRIRGVGRTTGPGVFTGRANAWKADETRPTPTRSALRAWLEHKAHVHISTRHPVRAPRITVTMAYVR
jgi:hypothetical protein